MKEIVGNLFAQLGWIAIPTNGVVKHNGRLVMGAGVAKYAASVFKNPDIDLVFGDHVLTTGNTPCPVYTHKVISFPTKHSFTEHSCLDLIADSATSIKEWMDSNEISELYLPKVGCGYGGLDWDVVRNKLESVFDDRFIVVF